MLTVFERSVSLIGNIASILGLVFALLEKVGIYSVGAIKVTDRKTALALVIAFIFFGSYAAATTLAKWKHQEKEVLVLWFPMTLAYSLTFWFLLENFLPLAASSREPQLFEIIPAAYVNLFLTAVVVNAAMMTWFYYWRAAYPSGHSVFATPESGASSRLGFVAIHLFALIALLFALSP